MLALRLSSREPWRIMGFVGQVWSLVRVWFGAGLKWQSGRCWLCRQLFSRSWVRTALVRSTTWFNVGPFA